MTNPSPMVDGGTEAMPSHQRDHYKGSYSTRSAKVREDAYADPQTRCWRCGRTLDQEQALHPLKKVTWHAGHLIDGDYLSPLLAEHSTCNTSAGAKVGNAKRMKRPRSVGLNPSERWY